MPPSSTSLRLYPVCAELRARVHPRVAWSCWWCATLLRNSPLSTSKKERWLAVVYLKSASRSISLRPNSCNANTLRPKSSGTPKVPIPML